MEAYSGIFLWNSSSMNLSSMQFFFIIKFDRPILDFLQIEFYIDFLQIEFYIETRF